jgi:hypothetical protein
MYIIAAKTHYLFKLFFGETLPRERATPEGVILISLQRFWAHRLVSATAHSLHSSVNKVTLHFVFYKTEHMYGSLSEKKVEPFTYSTETRYSNTKTKKNTELFIARYNILIDVVDMHFFLNNLDAYLQHCIMRSSRNLKLYLFVAHRQ